MPHLPLTLLMALTAAAFVWAFGFEASAGADTPTQFPGFGDVSRFSGLVCIYACCSDILGAPNNQLVVRIGGIECGRTGITAIVNGRRRTTTRWRPISSLPTGR